MMRNTKTVDIDKGQLRYFDYDAQAYVTMQIDSSEFQKWLSQGETFNIEFIAQGERPYLHSDKAKMHSITFRAERRKGTDNLYWSAYSRKRTHSKKLVKKYVGTSPKITLEKLRAILKYFDSVIFEP